MGAKTALLAFTDGDLGPALLGATRSTVAESEALVREIFPAYDVTLPPCCPEPSSCATAG